ncbi:MAG: substrate-binding domain-containing protein, partial [Lachnospiraceae bacterium]|nr:substrate-binding domain-containing protein [Lachnospiraceae bacterium]
TIVADDLMAYGNKIEVIFCNNDAMALGAIRAIKAAGRTVGKDVFLVGVDALKEACQAILDGDMTGTVFNDHITQAHSVADCAIKFIEGKRVDNYIACDYVKVTKDNAQEILDLLK